MRDHQLLSGFANYLQSEAIEGALPQPQNSPQHVPFNLYAEQISGSAFTCPRSKNYHLWCYRIQPSVTHPPYQLHSPITLFTTEKPPSPNQMRFSPQPLIKDKTVEFIEGLQPIASNTHARTYLYRTNCTHSGQFVASHDGELLLVPQHGLVTLTTELGELSVGPSEIAVIPRGIKFQVIGKQTRGYLCESLQGRFRLPELGVIGANGLANPHDFLHPTARYYDQHGTFQLFSIYQNHVWTTTLDYHPFNVVAWKGNYLPYKYDLKKFNTLNTVSFDHPDPSIFTVLTVPSPIPGVPFIDFVIFPERWMVAENTFRPPYFHRNIMNEFMGLILGQYDGKKEGFIPGGFSIHNCMAAHGVDAVTYQAAISKPLTPEKYANSLAFMFESNLPWDLCESASQLSIKQKDYYQCWSQLKSHFNGPR